MKPVFQERAHRLGGVRPGTARLVLLCCVASLWAGASLLRSTTTTTAGGRAPARGLSLGGRQQQEGASPVTGPQACAAAAPPRAKDAAPHCQLLRYVCVDQGTFVTHDPQFLPEGAGGAGGAGRALPHPSSGTALYTHAWTGDRAADEVLEEERAWKHHARIPDPVFRARSADEPRPYLASPVFSNCTVPVVAYPPWLGNYFHAFNDLASWMHAVVGRAPWGSRAKLVVVTPEGGPLPAHASLLLEPLSPFTVDTLADFSNRLDGEGRAGGQRPRARWLGDATPQKPVSAEGTEQRCFRHLFLCPARGDVGPGNWQLGQTLVDHYRPLLPPPPLAFSRAAEGLMAGGTGVPAADGSRLLRVVFQLRKANGVRTILNLAELLAECSAWAFVDPDSGARFSAECSTWTFGSDFLANAAVAQQADVFVGVHGANLVNAWLMRPGSSVVEITPWGFGAGSFAYMALGMYNERDPDTQLQWFLLTVCDPAASRPGALEAAQRGPRASWARDRHSVISFEALRPILRRIAVNDGDMGRYRRQFSRRGWWFQMTPNGTQFGRVGVRCSEEGAELEVDGGGPGWGPAPAPVTAPLKRDPT